MNKLVVFSAIFFALSGSAMAENTNGAPQSVVKAPVVGTSAGKWTVSTDDTRLTVGATATGQLCVYALSNPADNWNWTIHPSVFDLVSMAQVGATVCDLHWNSRRRYKIIATGRKCPLPL